MTTYIIPTTGKEPFSFAPTLINTLESTDRCISCLPETIETSDDAIRATEIIAKINGYIKETEAEHKQLKAPYLEKSRALDSLKKKILAVFQERKDKLNARIVAYQRTEQEKLRKANEEAARKAAEIAAAAAKEREALDPVSAIAHEAATDIVTRQAAANIVAAASAAPVAGLRVTRKAVIDSVNLALLAASRIDLCKIEANLPLIKAEILAGKSVPGVVAHVEETASVRADNSVSTEDFDY